ncbi:7710_t:CDS:2, partial [Gigaspora margarita]
MIKFSIFIIIALFVTLVNSENANDTSNPLLYDDPEIIHPSKDAIQNIFDLMILEYQENFENQERKRFISQELKQFVNNELEELKNQQKILRDRLKSIHCSYFVYKA